MPKKRRHIKRHFSANTTRTTSAQRKPLAHMKPLAQNSQISHEKQPVSQPIALNPDVIDQLPDAIRGLLMDWYERGIRRGLKKATDLMLEDQIFKEDGILHAPNSIEIKLKTRCGDEQWESRQVTIDAKEIGFER